MKMSKTILSRAIAAAIGMTGLVSVAAAGDLKFTFTDNTTSVWGAGLEFAITTAYGSVNDGPKDIFFGGETWTFTGSSTSNLVGGVLSSVSRKLANWGASIQAPITSGQSGFPICSTPGSCDALQQDFFIGGGAFNFLAPVAGSVTATAYASPMKILAWDTSGAANSVQIWMPVAHGQWGGTLIIGADPTRVPPGVMDGDKITHGTAPAGPGVTFVGSASGGVFHLTAAPVTTRDEVSIYGFAGQTFNWDITGTYAITPHGTSAVPVPAAVWLLGSGLLGLMGAFRRKKE